MSYTNWKEEDLVRFYNHHLDRVIKSRASSPAKSALSFYAIIGSLGATSLAIESIFHLPIMLRISFFAMLPGVIVLIMRLRNERNDGRCMAELVAELSRRGISV